MPTRSQNYPYLMGPPVQKIYNRKIGLWLLASVALLGGGGWSSSSSLMSFHPITPTPGDFQDGGNFAYLQSFSHLEAMKRGGSHLFAERIVSRLPKYKGLMQSAARSNNLDWPLLAAMSYQESFWNPDARSPTGVRGLMMLTEETARELNVHDRLDPRQSIQGGARYFARLRDRLPASISEPDRTWIALAAYNMGMSHLEDARILTQHLGKNPDLWRDVREQLPLLQQPEYYRYLKSGFARGEEALAYVERIRQYRTVLTWHEQIEVNGLAVVRDNVRYAGALTLVPRDSLPRSASSL